MTRPLTTAFVGVSLDGFLARPDGSVDWLSPFEKVDHGYQAFMDSVDTLAVGRSTYDFVISMLRTGLSWPYPGKRYVVVTHRPIEAAHGERAFEGEPSALLESLQREGARHVYVDGGRVIRSFLSEGLLDHLVISIVPVLLGEGLPLFGGIRVDEGLVLEKAVPYSDGVVQLRYRVAGGSNVQP